MAGVWLAILGHWKLILVGIGSLFFSTWLLGLALLPAMLIIAPGVYLAQKGKRSYILLFGIMSMLYTFVVVTIWSGAVLYFCIDMIKSRSAIIPVLLWSYGIATGPLAYMASRGPVDSSAGSLLVTVFSQLGYATMIALMYLAPMSFANGMIVFSTVLFIGLIFQLKLAHDLNEEAVLIDS